MGYTLFSHYKPHPPFNLIFFMNRSLSLSKGLTVKGFQGNSRSVSGRINRNPLRSVARIAKIPTHDGRASQREGN